MSSHLGSNKVKQLINGQLQTSSTKIWIDVTNPATQEVIAQVPCATDEEVDQAIASAQKAFSSWSNTPVPERARLMLRPISSRR
ncbi:MAG: aldehyde dehydrogenase family protein, partial [Pseudomonadales bacterium]|nr:aldehyde dehydrogenase family protein [Pseudomonadales bacterium]